MDKSKIICLDSETTGFSVGQDETKKQSGIMEGWNRRVWTI